MRKNSQASIKTPPEHGRFAYDGLDRVIHERARLGILTSLVASRGGLTFNDLKELCDLTDGNLNRHLDVLSEAGLVEIRKQDRGRRAQTVCRLSASGRARFLAYLEELERVMADAQAADSVKAPVKASRLGLSTA